MMSTNPDASIFCPDDLSLRESEVLKSPTINGLTLIFVFQSVVQFFNDTNCTRVWYICTKLITYFNVTIPLIRMKF